jgi:hypothetical protein
MLSSTDSEKEDFTIVESEAVKLGYLANMDEKQAYAKTKAMFPYALRRRSVKHIRKEVERLKIRESITPSMAPTRDPELAICLSVKLIGPEEPNRVTFENAKLMYQDALKEFTPEQIKTQYETTLRSKVNVILLRVPLAEDERRKHLQQEIIQLGKLYTTNSGDSPFDVF